MTSAVCSIFILVCIVLLFESKKPTGIFRRLSKVGLPVVWLLLVLIATFRPEEMADYDNYEHLYNLGYSPTDRIELGYYWINRLFRHIDDGLLWLFCFMALLSIGLKLYSIRRMSPLIWVSVAVYISHFFILHDMIQIRAAVASGLALFAIYYKVKGKLLPFIITLGISILFHYSTMLLVVIWFLNPTKYQRNVYIWLIPAAYAMAISGLFLSKFLMFVPIERVQILLESYSQGFNFEEYVNIFNLRQMLQCVICIFLWLNCKRIASQSPYFLLSLKLYTIGLSIIPLFADLSGAFRMSELYSIVEVLLFPCIVLAMPRKFAIVGKLAVIAIATAFLLVNIYSRDSLLV